MGRETGRCAERHEKVGAVLRFTLLSVLSLLNWREKCKKVGAIKGRRREPAKISKSPKIFSKSFFKVFLWKFFFKICFEGVKMYS